MESIIYDSIIQFFTDHHLIPTQQHGFLPGKSIQSNLLCCLSEWSKELDAGNSIDVLYLDFSKAFDRVPKRRLIYKLHHLGLRGNLLRWIDSFLSNRTFRVKVGDAFSRPFKALSGVPQGSVLGPLLFVAYTADLKNILLSPFSMYADDIKLYNLSTKSVVLKQDLLTLKRWSLDWFLPFNTDKCNVLYVDSNNSRLLYHIDGQELAASNCCRDLGVCVTSDLSWSHQITSITKKANCMLFLLSRAFQKTTPVVFAKLYKTFVRPILEFANSVWTSVLKRDVLLLESVQRRATRIRFGRTRPHYNDRLSIMMLPSLAERRLRGDLITTFHAMSDSTSPIGHVFTLTLDTRTRGQKYKLLKENFKTTAKQFFITNRVFEHWNSLPEEIINSQSTVMFKSRYDTYCSQRVP